MEKLTNKQKDLYDFIKKYIDNYGYSPTVREICNIFQRSPGSIHPMLKIIRNKGYITFEEKKSRTIKIVN